LREITCPVRFALIAMNYYLGIDVGTGSARAGIFDGRGRLAAAASRPIRMWKPAVNHVEQSSDDIWKACCAATRHALRKSGLRASVIKGIGFDATCSLVALDKSDRPVSVSTTGKGEQNVIVWMDHRAVDQAGRINRTKHPVLRYVGGAISPEMQTPKLLWLKENQPAAWRRAARFFDLPDFLTYRATGDDTRSLCTTVCKWTYLGHKGPDGRGWYRSYFARIGLGDLAADRFGRIGRKIRPMGEPVGQGLTVRAARELGLVVGTPVGVAIIDAHAGGLGLLGAKLDGAAATGAVLNRRLALIGGTSSCHMAVSAGPRFIRGIWGPYYSAMIPGLWLTEGGQSATGALIDHIIHTHAAAPELRREATRSGKTVYELLNARVAALARAEKLTHPAELTRELQVLPDFHGNRSPRADPTLRGVISGLTLSATVDDLARLYLATIQAIACGTRHIVEEMNRQGYRIDTLFVCGGGTKNPLFLREHADITGCRLVVPSEPEAVLLGSAVLGAVASGRHASILQAMNAMNRIDRVIVPGRGHIARYHAARYRIFHRLHAGFVADRKTMASC
jgi:FGGY-family pentulose kinase